MYYIYIYVYIHIYIYMHTHTRIAYCIISAVPQKSAKSAASRKVAKLYRTSLCIMI